MATTRLTNIVPIKTFESIVEGKLTENSKFRQSGIVQANDARITRLVQTAGFETTLRDWRRPVGGEATSQNDDPTNKAVPKNVVQNSMVARIIARSNSFSAMDIADLASDADAIEFAASEFARLRLADEESALLAICEGVVAKGGADYVHNAAITTGTIDATNKFSIPTLLNGRRKLGDKGGELSVVAMHSDVVNNLRAAEPNAFVPASQTRLGLETYAGTYIIETDNLVKGGTANFPIYTNYFFGAGMFAYGAASVENALVQFRDELAGGGSGEETVLNRFRYALHPYGFSNDVAPANGVSQTNAELKSADTWTVKAQDRKAVPLVAIRTNG